MIIKLDDYIKKNNLKQEDVYAIVLLTKYEEFKEHISGDSEIYIDKYATRYLNHIYKINNIDNNNKENNKEIKDIEKSIIQQTMENIEIDDVSFDNIDLSCVINNSNKKKFENETNEFIDSMIAKSDVNTVNEALRKIIIKDETDIVNLKGIIQKQNEVIEELNKLVLAQKRI